MFSAPDGSDVLFSGLRPGLRIGSWDANWQNELFLDTSLEVISGEGSTFWTMSNTLNYSHAFGSRSAPYVTFGLGFAKLSDGSNSSSTGLYGAGFGLRELLRHGHGSIRAEFRFDRADPEGAPDAVDILGIRVGFDLDLD